MKIKNLLILGLVLLGFTYCSSDDVLENTNDKSPNTGTKMQLVVNMPTGVTTRAGVTTEDGTDEENKANEVLVAIFNKEGTDFVASYNQSLVAISETSYQTPVFEVNDLVVGNSYKVYLFVNPYKDLDEKSLEAAFKSTNSLSDAIAAFAADSNFFMSTAGLVTAGEVKETAKNEATPYNVTADVERAAARFDYKAAKTENKYEIDATNNVGVKLVSYKLLNTSRTFYNLKRVTATGDNIIIGGEETTNNYVVDADWSDFKSQETLPAWSDYFFSHIRSIAQGETLTAYTNLNTDNDYKKLTYALENTLPEAKKSSRALATAVVFKGVLTKGGIPIDKVNESPLVYVWNNTYYGEFSELPKGIQDLNGGNPTAENLSNAGVTGYSWDEAVEGYAVYYTYYNKHNANDNNTETGPMEFAVVRNNVYKLSITNISLFGNSNDPEIKDPTNPDPNPENPENPIEAKHIYMDVKAEVLPWTVRENNIEF